LTVLIVLIVEFLGQNCHCFKPANFAGKLIMRERAADGGPD
jgi:hypothetical protein